MTVHLWILPEGVSEPAELFEPCAELMGVMGGWTLEPEPDPALGVADPESSSSSSGRQRTKPPAPAPPTPQQHQQQLPQQQEQQDFAWRWKTEAFFRHKGIWYKSLGGLCFSFCINELLVYDLLIHPSWLFSPKSSTSDPSSPPPISFSINSLCFIDPFASCLSFSTPLKK